MAICHGNFPQQLAAGTDYIPRYHPVSPPNDRGRSHRRLQGQPKCKTGLNEPRQRVPAPNTGENLLPVFRFHRGSRLKTKSKHSSIKQIIPATG